MAAVMGGRMAIATLTPDTESDPEPIPDPVTFEEAALLFRETGHPEVTQPSVKNLANKFYRWAREDGLPMERRGRKHVVSYSDLLVAHATRHPAPGR
jgi:hypothetical protein